MDTRVREPALDGLRALCVAAVLASGYHWLLPFGWSGVQVFFVLSGYLITDILIGHRRTATAPVGFFRPFYFRRAVRILPLYFAYLFALQVVDVISRTIPDWSVVRWYALGHALNVGMVMGAIQPYDAYGHLWTLSVEEQFYLVWPLIIWLLPHAWFARLALALMIVGPLVRYGSTLWPGLNFSLVYLSPFSHVDAFATGALLAIYGYRIIADPRRAAIACVALTAAAGVAILISVPGLAMRTLGYPEGMPYAYAYVWGYTAINLCAVFMIAAALNGQVSWLRHPMLAYVGRISYGVYLFQRPVKGLYLAWIEPTVNRVIPSTTFQNVVGYCACALTAIAVAALSHHVLEAPLLAWRDRRPMHQAHPC